MTFFGTCLNFGMYAFYGRRSYGDLSFRRRGMGRATIVNMSAPTDLEIQMWQYEDMAKDPIGKKDYSEAAFLVDGLFKGATTQELMDRAQEVVVNHGKYLTPMQNLTAANHIKLMAAAYAKEDWRGVLIHVLLASWANAGTFVEN